MIFIVFQVLFSGLSMGRKSRDLPVPCLPNPSPLKTLYLKIRVISGLLLAYLPIPYFPICLFAYLPTCCKMWNMTNTPVRILVATFTVMLLWVSLQAIAGETNPASKPTNLGYWLGQARPVDSAKTKPAEKHVKSQAPPAKNERLARVGFRRDDALPGVVEFSDGLQLAGGIFTTRNKPLALWIPQQKRWLRVPIAAVLSISAVVVQQEMKLRWRWKAMGQPERVYTGKSYPFRRFEWLLHLADGSYIQGIIKGQPIWIETPHETSGPFILHERAKGKTGQSLAKQVYIRKIVISRKMMDKVGNRQVGNRQ